MSSESLSREPSSENNICWVKHYKGLKHTKELCGIRELGKPKKLPKLWKQALVTHKGLLMEKAVKPENLVWIVLLCRGDNQFREMNLARNSLVLSQDPPTKIITLKDEREKHI